MKLRKAAAGFAVVASVLGVVSSATPAMAGCESEIVMFFSPGTTVEGTQVTARSTNPAAAGCIVGDASGTDVNLFYVAPGMSFAKARHTAASSPVSGSVSGMGANFNGVWPMTEHAIPGNFYSESPFVAMDPTTTSGAITAAAQGATQTYRTIDR